MLATYDAEAVAEVLGLAFVRQANSSPARGRAEGALSNSEADIVIHVDDSTIVLIELEGENPPVGRGAFEPGAASALHPLARPSPTFIEKAVAGGLPRNALRHVAEVLAGTEKGKVSAFEWDVVPKTTLDRRTRRLSVGESERTERIARLFVHARRALGTADEARDFMTAPHPELDGRSPLDVAATDLGTRRAEQILTAIEYGLAL